MNFEKAKKLSKIDPYFMKRKDLIFLVQYFTKDLNLMIKRYYEDVYKHSYAHSKYMGYRLKLAETYKKQMTKDYGYEYKNDFKTNIKRMIYRLKRDFYFNKMTKLEKKLFKNKQEI